MFTLANGWRYQDLDGNWQEGLSWERLRQLSSTSVITNTSLVEHPWLGRKTWESTAFGNSKADNVAGGPCPKPLDDGDYRKKQLNLAPSPNLTAAASSIGKDVSKSLKRANEPALHHGSEEAGGNESRVQGSNKKLKTDYDSKHVVRSRSPFEADSSNANSSHKLVTHTRNDTLARKQPTVFKTGNHREEESKHVLSNKLSSSHMNKQFQPDRLKPTSVLHKKLIEADSDSSAKSSSSGSLGNVARVGTGRGEVKQVKKPLHNANVRSLPAEKEARHSGQQRSMGNMKPSQISAPLRLNKQSPADILRSLEPEGAARRKKEQDLAHMQSGLPRNSRPLPNGPSPLPLSGRLNGGQGLSREGSITSRPNFASTLSRPPSSLHSRDVSAASEPPKPLFGGPYSSGHTENRNSRYEEASKGLVGRPGFQSNSLSSTAPPFKPLMGSRPMGGPTPLPIRESRPLPISSQLQKALGNNSMAQSPRIQAAPLTTTSSRGIDSIMNGVAIMPSGQPHSAAAIVPDREASPPVRGDPLTIDIRTIDMDEVYKRMEIMAENKDEDGYFEVLVEAWSYQRIGDVAEYGPIRILELFDMVQRKELIADDVSLTNEEAGTFKLKDMLASKNRYILEVCEWRRKLIERKKKDEKLDQADEEMLRKLKEREEQRKRAMSRSPPRISDRVEERNRESEERQRSSGERRERHGSDDAEGRSGHRDSRGREESHSGRSSDRLDHSNWDDGHRRSEDRGRAAGDYDRHRSDRGSDRHKSDRGSDWNRESERSPVRGSERRDYRSRDVDDTDRDGHYDTGGVDMDDDIKDEDHTSDLEFKPLHTSIWEVDTPYYPEPATDDSLIQLEHIIASLPPPPPFFRTFYNLPTVPSWDRQEDSQASDLPLDTADTSTLHDSSPRKCDTSENLLDRTNTRSQINTWVSQPSLRPNSGTGSVTLHSKDLPPHLLHASFMPTKVVSDLPPHLRPPSIENVLPPHLRIKEENGSPGRVALGVVRR